MPKMTIEREDGWRGFRIQGILDFSLIGILSKLSGILADNKIGIFAISTFNTDYILVKDAQLSSVFKAFGALYCAQFFSSCTFYWKSTYNNLTVTSV